MESRLGGTIFKFGLPRSAVSSEADEQGDGKANGGQLEEDARYLVNRKRVICINLMFVEIVIGVGGQDPGSQLQGVCG